MYNRFYPATVAESETNVATGDRSMPVTMRDVAALAGVSPVVVSKVLHNRAQSVRVSEETAERVRQAAGKLGYRCNVWARNFREQKTMAIGILHGIGFGRPLFNRGSRYFSALMDGIVEGAFENSYSVTLCPRLLSRSPEDAMTDGRFDGLVWYSAQFSDESMKMVMECSVPLVVIHSHSEMFEHRHPTVICDNDQGIDLAVDHLVSLGHRNIAFAAAMLYTTHETAERRVSFVRSMKRHGITVEPDDILDFSSGTRSVDAFLSGSRKYTAIVADSDAMAAELLNRAPVHGISIPEDLSVVGFDSTSFCDELRPALTSVSQPLFEIGQKSIERLVQVINGNWVGPSDDILPCGLDIRGSTTTLHST